MKIKKITISLLFLCVYAVSFVQDVKAQGSEVKEPYYVIDFSITAANVDIRVNDISIFHEEIKGHMGVKMPANNAIFKSGRQKLSLELTPLAGEKYLDANAEVGLAVEFVDAMNFNTISRESFEVLKSSPDGSPMEKLHSEFTFNAEVPYEITILGDAQDLREVKDLEAKLKKAYRELYTMIEKREFSAFESVLRAKYATIAQMLYLSEKESKDRVKRVISDLKNENTKLKPFPSEVVLNIEAGGKLAKLKNENGNEILTFEDDEGETELHFSFYLPKGSDKFIAF